MQRHVRRPALLGLLGLTMVAPSVAQEAAPAAAPKFSRPVALRAGGELLRVEAPGYAAPAWHDVDGDGRKDLVVGQFAGGKLRVYRGLENGEFAAGEWLEAEGDVAEVPGVW